MVIVTDHCLEKEVQIGIFWSEGLQYYSGVYVLKT